LALGSNSKTTKAQNTKKNKSAGSRINLNVREHERINLLSIERCLWDTDNFTQEQLQCKASKRERERERQENSTPKVYQKFVRFRESLSYSCNIERERE